jgi:hypothetical protein
MSPKPTTEAQAEACTPNLPRRTLPPSDHRRRPPHPPAPAPRHWARRAVEAGKLTPKPSWHALPRTSAASYEEAVIRKARQLVDPGGAARRVVPCPLGRHTQGLGYLLHPRPVSPCPTVQRTLRPLAYTPPAKADGTPDTDARRMRLAAHATPEEILARARPATPPAARAPSRWPCCATSPTPSTPAVHHHGRVD